MKKQNIDINWEYVDPQVYDISDKNRGCPVVFVSVEELKNKPSSKGKL
jgi:hypothetical protein